jgi:hypothetical protein
MSPSSVVATVRTTDSTSQGGRHRRLQLQWWPLPEIPTAPPRGPAIDIFYIVGGRCQKYRQHPICGLPSASSTSVVATAGNTNSTPRGPVIDVVFNFDGGCCRKYR